MPRREQLVLCGDTGRLASKGVAVISLRLHGAQNNVALRISDISQRLLANIPDALLDLIEVASYVYSADSAVRRTDSQMGARWRRNFRLVIPVRQPDLWSSDQVKSALAETLSFLSDDDYTFEFSGLQDPSTSTDYFELPVSEDTAFIPDDVILFSGGLDSFSGTVNALADQGKKVALVSHRSSPKIAEAQKYLVEQLRDRFGSNRLRHIPVWMTLRGRLGQERTHRTRSFLFAALGAATAHLFRRDRILFFENGVVSLNLPFAAQVVGGRATRTTHPQALSGFCRVLTNVFGHLFSVDNPYAWVTKAEVAASIARSGHGDLIRHTRSCTRIHEMTKLHSHCGRCSQCIDRRFAIIAAGGEAEDPEEAYGTDLFVGSLQPGPDREMALAYIHGATAINQMTDAAFFANYGETSRVVDFFPEPPTVVASRIYDLYQRHAGAVCGVFENAIRLQAANLRRGNLPQDCLLRLVVGRRSGEPAIPTPQHHSAPAVPDTLAITVSIDVALGRVVFSRWGEIKGVGAGLLIALAQPFRQAARDELAPMNYPYITAANLAHQVNCATQEALRRRVLSCRNAITRRAQAAGDPPPPLDAIIENHPWHGYRLNPDRVRLVALGELGETGHASATRGNASRREPQDSRR